jgi:hypothetical protein
MTSKSVIALAAILALGSLSLATDASAAHGGGHGGGHAADTLVADISGLGTERAHGSWLDMDPPYTSGMDFTGAHSAYLDTGGISGMAVGGITALVHAGYGPTITASTCGAATKILGHHFGD